MNRFNLSRTKIVAFALIGLTLASVPAAAGSYYYHNHNYGGAVAAGVVGGLVLGGLAASAAAPRAYYAPDCWIQRQKFYNKYGKPYYRDVQVCR